MEHQSPGRHPNAFSDRPVPAGVDQLLDGANVMITGGTGSFGKSFVTRLLGTNVKRIAIYSRDELKQYEMQQAQPFRDDPRLRFLIGDVRDANRLELAMRDIDYVIHAAAMKHVSIAEYNPFECIHTNIMGAENVVRGALRNRVKRVVALSTDKAVNPVNLYGASKLASDKIFVAANNLSGSAESRFAVVRYGNVVGSRGSVVPLFKRLVDEGADHLPITDPAMTRFWITLAQGVDFVLASLIDMRGAEIFVPKIPSMRLVDLAEAIAPKLEQRVVGIRPGEKLHEIMITPDDARSVVALDDRYVIEPEFAWFRRISWTNSGGVPVPPRFAYASDSNEDWLGIDDLRAMLGASQSDGAARAGA
jgi:UDP-N-acetylglucosamine 4,6-dehydratase